MFEVAVAQETEEALKTKNQGSNAARTEIWDIKHVIHV